MPRKGAVYPSKAPEYRQAYEKQWYATMSPEERERYRARRKVANAKYKRTHPAKVYAQSKASIKSGANARAKALYRQRHPDRVKASEQRRAANPEWRAQRVRKTQRWLARQPVETREIYRQSYLLSISLQKEDPCLALAVNCLRQIRAHAHPARIKSPVVEFARLKTLPTS